MKKLLALIIALLMLCACAPEEPEKPFVPEEPQSETEISEQEEIQEETEIPEETPETEDNEENGDGLSALHEDMIINYGGIINYEGKLTVRKGVSLYYDNVGISDYSLEDPQIFYSWIMSRTSVDDRTEVSIPGFSGNVYAYSADFFEEEVLKYFGRTAESLRVQDFYYPEQNCYYLDGHGGMGDVPEIVVNSIDEDGDLIIFHLTLDFSAENDRSMALTVKLLPDGGYNYVSYMRE